MRGASIGAFGEEVCGSVRLCAIFGKMGKLDASLLGWSSEDMAGPLSRVVWLAACVARARRGRTVLPPTFVHPRRARTGGQRLREIVLSLFGSCQEKMVGNLVGRGGQVGTVVWTFGGEVGVGVFGKDARAPRTPRGEMDVRLAPGGGSGFGVGNCFAGLTGRSLC
jgi:hypothetical protein